jgi:hypothetical protein
VWGWELIGTLNTVGTKATPLAAMTMELDWKVSNPLVKEQSSMNFWIKGDGSIKQL